MTSGGTLRLPRSSSRQQRGFAFCRVLTFVARSESCSAGFEGAIYPSGAEVQRAELPARLVVLECLGPVGNLQRRKRETVWILWRWDAAAQEWREIARAAAVGWEWAIALRETAWQALNGEARLYDVLDRSRLVALEIGAWIEERLKREERMVRASALASVLDRLCGQIAENRAA